MDLMLTPEQEALRQLVRELMTERVQPRAAEIDQNGEFPQDVRALFAEHGLFAATVPPEYGGLDGSLVTISLIAEEISRVCASSGMVFCNQYLGTGPIALFGNQEQKQRYLPRLGTGEWLCSFALTEPGAGSDVNGIATRAVPDGVGWRLNGRKCFITHANVADVVTVFAKAEVDGEPRLSAFLIERSMPGWAVDKIEHKMGLRGSPTCSIVLEDCWVPAANLLGGIGDGQKIAFGSLNKGRIMCGSQALGIAQGALEAAVTYAGSREQFGRPIGQFQAIQMILADMEAEVQAARALLRTAAWKYDTGAADIVRIASAAKLFATEMVNRVTSSAVQVLGGYGYISDYPVERMMRDARIFAIFEGSNQIQRTVIAKQLLKGI